MAIQILNTNTLSQNLELIRSTLNETKAVLPDGSAGNDLGYLCKSSKINKWSKCKPFISNVAIFNPYSDKLVALKNSGWGLSWNGGADITDFTHNKPTGGVNSYYRLYDFDGYEHNAGCGFGLISTGESIVITPLNIDTSKEISLNGGPSDDTYIGYWDLKDTLFSGYKNVQLVAQMPRSNLVSDSVFAIEMINMDNFSLNGGKFSLSYQVLSKIGLSMNRNCTLFTRLYNNAQSAFIVFLFAGKRYVQIKSDIGGITLPVWNGSDPQNNIKIGISPTSLSTCEYYTSVINGNPVYLDCQSSSFYITTNSFVNPSDSGITLNQDNTLLRITNWTNNTHYYLTVRAGANLSNWSLNAGNTMGFSLGQNVQNLPNMGTGMFGFSLVYKISNEKYIPLTQEVFGRIKWPASSYNAVNIF